VSSIGNVDTRKSLFEYVFIVEFGEIKIEKIPSEDNLAYVFSKSLPRSRFNGA